MLTQILISFALLFAILSNFFALYATSDLVYEHEQSYEYHPTFGGITDETAENTQSKSTALGDREIIPRG